MQYRPKHIVEYCVLRSIAGLLNILPHRAAIDTGCAIAWFVFHVCKFRVEETERRIRLVFGDKYSRKEVRNIAWISWRNTVLNGVEMLRLPKLTRAWFDKHYEEPDSCLATMRDHCADGNSAIIAVPHMGNWDLAGVYCHVHGVPIFNIAAKQKNPLVNDFFNKLRSSPGIETIERGTASMKTVIRFLKNGKALAILPDSRMRQPGIELPLLGGTANLGKGMASFARQTDTVIFPFIVTRKGKYNHSIRGFSPIKPNKELDKEEDISRMSALALESIDKAIHDEPEQWFWFNKRWVLDPVE